MKSVASSAWCKIHRFRDNIRARRRKPRDFSTPPRTPPTGTGASVSHVRLPVSSLFDTGRGARIGHPRGGAVSFPIPHSRFHIVPHSPFGISSHEGVDHRQWRPRTCFGLEDRAEPSRRASVRGPRQCRIGARRRERRHSADRYSAAGQIRQGKRGRPDGRGTGVAAGIGRGRRLASRGAASFRPDQGRRRTRREQGLLQEPAAACRRPHGRLSRFPQRRACDHLSQGPRRRAGGRQGRRPGGGKGRDRLRRSRRGAGRGPAHRRRARVRRRRRPDRDRRAARWTGSERTGHHRRADDRHAAAVPGPQARPRRRHRPEHRRHGGLLPRADHWTKSNCIGSKPTCSCPRCMP